MLSGEIFGIYFLFNYKIIQINFSRKDNEYNLRQK